MWKKYFDPKKTTFFSKPRKKKQTKNTTAKTTNLVQIHTPCLNSQFVKINL